MLQNDNHSTASEVGTQPVQPKVISTVCCMLQEQLVDAWEDALADVEYNMNTEYDVNRLVESMKLAVSIHEKIEYLNEVFKDTSSR